MKLVVRSLFFGVFGLFLLAGCDTSPSGGKLPPPPTDLTAEKAAADASAAAAEAYKMMGKQGGMPGMPGPPAQ